MGGDEIRLDCTHENWSPGSAAILPANRSAKSWGFARRRRNGGAPRANWRQLPRFPTTAERFPADHGSDPHDPNIVPQIMIAPDALGE